MSAHAIFYKKLRSKTFFYYFFCGVCVGVVGLNIIYSQKYNKNMYGVMEGEVVSTVAYLKHIWGTPLFNLEIEKYTADGRTDILSAWTEVKEANAKKIQRLESDLRIHPYSPEIYYNLFLLYSENGNGELAHENLRKAQKIDPSLR